MDVRLRAHFDLEHLLTLSGAAKPAQFDWRRPQPRLDDDTLFALGYMMDIESHTMIYLRDLLMTRVACEVEVTSFLACWAYEELFHGLLIKQLLGAQGVAVDDAHFEALRRQLRLRHSG